VADVTLTTGQPVAADETTVGHVGRVIVGVDDSAAGLAAIAAAMELARSHHAQLVAVRAWALGLPRHGGRRLRHLAHPHVVLSFSGAEQREAATVLIRRTFRAAVGRLPADAGIAIETPDSDPAVALVSVASQPGDVIVVGTGGGQLLRHLVHGSVSRYCTRHARCPVVVVPAQD
jgi:nucleotide-binding universal stress UspA family protein